MRAEGDFRKEIYSWKDQHGRNKTGRREWTAKSCWENLWNEIQLKGHRVRNRQKNRIKRSGQTLSVYIKDTNCSIPTTWRWARGDSMEISTEKTKLMTNSTSGINTEIKVNGQKLETVTNFKYLGSVITDMGSKPNKHRQQQHWQGWNQFGMTGVFLSVQG